WQPDGTPAGGRLSQGQAPGQAPRQVVVRRDEETQAPQEEAQGEEAPPVRRPRLEGRQEMRRRTFTAALLGLALVVALAVPTAAGAFAISSFQMQAIAEGGAPTTVSGSHPYEMTTKIAMRPEGS